MPDAPRQIKLGLLGCGYAAREVHAPRLRRLADLFHVVGVSDVNQAAAATVSELLGGTPVFDDLEQLISGSRCDALAVLTPVHAGQVRAALAHGLDVFVEKPLCETPVEARELVGLATEHQRVVLTGSMRRFDRAVALAGELLPALGPLLWVRVLDLASSGASAATPSGDLREPVLQERLLAAGARSSRARNTLQTMLLEFIHDLSVLSELFSTVECCDARASEDGWSVVGRLELDDQIPCSFTVAEFGVPKYPAFENRVELVGQSGALEIRLADANTPGAPAIVTLIGGDQEILRDQKLDAGDPTIAAADEASQIKGGDSPAGAQTRTWHLSTDAYELEWRAFHTGIEHRALTRGSIERAARDVELAWEIGTKATSAPSNPATVANPISAPASDSRQV